jgi:hypothetical protein
VSHRASNGGLARTRSIEMTCAVEWAEHNDLAIRLLFQCERLGLNLKGFVQRRLAAVIRA